MVTSFGNYYDLKLCDGMLCYTSVKYVTEGHICLPPSFVPAWHVCGCFLFWFSVIKIILFAESLVSA